MSVELREYPKTHPFAGTQYADNICAFNTVRYTPTPSTLDPEPRTLHPSPCALHPAPCTLQGYLAHQKTPPTRTLRQAYA